MKTDPTVLAASVLKLLQDRPRNYLRFGAYWFFIKDLLKRTYTRDNLHLLGNYVDPSVVARMPAFDNLDDALQAAIAEYNQNTRYNLDRDTVEDPTSSGSFILNDEDY